jgi:amidohydrolase
LVTAIQSIVSRNVSPLESAVITVGRFQAGVASNVIPRETLLDGTIRTLGEGTRALIVERLGELTESLEKSHRVSGELTVNAGYPVLVNDAGMVEFCRREAEKLLGASAVKIGAPRMGAEDFAFFLQRYPGVLIRLGCHNPEAGYLHGLHSPYFDFDERALDVGVQLFGHLLMEFDG